LSVYINGLDIHFVHVKAKKNKDTQVMPVLLLHGWPGRKMEKLKEKGEKKLIGERERRS
jgi:hypothetical protein